MIEIDKRDYDEAAEYFAKAFQPQVAALAKSYLQVTKAAVLELLGTLNCTPEDLIICSQDGAQHLLHKKLLVGYRFNIEGLSIKPEEVKVVAEPVKLQRLVFPPQD